MDEFVQDPTLEKLDRCTKADLLSVANFFDVSLSLNTRKVDIKKCVSEKLVVHLYLQIVPGIYHSNFWRSASANKLLLAPTPVLQTSTCSLMQEPAGHRLHQEIVADRCSPNLLHKASTNNLQASADNCNLNFNNCSQNFHLPSHWRIMTISWLMGISLCCHELGVLWFAAKPLRMAHFSFVFWCYLFFNFNW